MKSGISIAKWFLVLSLVPVGVAKAGGGGSYPSASARGPGGLMIWSVGGPGGTRTVTRNDGRGHITRRVIARHPTPFAVSREGERTAGSIRNPDGSRTVTQIDGRGGVSRRVVTARPGASARAVDLQGNRVESVGNADGSRTVTRTSPAGRRLSTRVLR